MVLDTISGKYLGCDPANVAALRGIMKEILAMRSSWKQLNKVMRQDGASTY